MKQNYLILSDSNTYCVNESSYRLNGRSGRQLHDCFRPLTHTPSRVRMRASLDRGRKERKLAKVRLGSKADSSPPVERAAALQVQPRKPVVLLTAISSQSAWRSWMSPTGGKRTVCFRVSTARFRTFVHAERDGGLAPMSAAHWRLETATKRTLTRLLGLSCPAPLRCSTSGLPIH